MARTDPDRVLPPSPRPCGSCPYRRDVPSAVWDRVEYEKLPRFDAETFAQPTGVFLCHQRNERLCGGWVGCHGGELLGLRLAVADGRIRERDIDAVFGYESPVPLWPSGAAAATHGMRDLDAPSDEAVTLAAKLARQHPDIAAEAARRG